MQGSRLTVRVVTQKHEAASKTELFFEEMSKLMPWFGPGSGAWYVVFEKHIEEAEI